MLDRHPRPGSSRVHAAAWSPSHRVRVKQLPQRRWPNALLALLASTFSLFVAGCGLTGFRTYRIASESMAPTLYEGDTIVANQAFYAHHAIKDGDVIVFRHNGAVLAKRVSALAGETIEARNGTLFRNHKALEEPYVSSSTDTEPDTRSTFPSRTVPNGQIFVTGDHRNMSLDSHFEEYGPVYVADVLGKVTYVYASHHGNAGRSF